MVCILALFHYLKVTKRHTQHLNISYAFPYGYRRLSKILNHKTKRKQQRRKTQKAKMEQEYKQVSITETDSEGTRRLKNATKRKEAIDLYMTSHAVNKKGITYQLKDMKGDKLRKVAESIQDNTIKVLFSNGLTTRATTKLNQTLNEDKTTI